MSFSAKLLSTTANSQDKEDEKRNDNQGSSSNSLFDGLLNVRTLNRGAEFSGKEDKLAKTSSFYKFLSDLGKGMDSAVNLIFGMENSTAKRYDDTVQVFVDDIVSGKGLKESAANAISKLNTTPQSGVVAKPVIYSDWSPASKLFGMNQETAFSEHLVNTAHQREVADLKAAGLNPVLGISGSGASSVSGSMSGGSSSAAKADDNKMLDVLGATAAVITAVATKNPMYGFMVSNIFKAFD